jgi:hypothetical protein
MLPARGGIGPAPFDNRSARFAKPLANDFPGLRQRSCRPLGWDERSFARCLIAVLPMAEAFSSRRALYAPMLLPQDSRYSAAPG